MQQRRRFKQTVSLQDRISSFSETALKVAALLPPGAERDVLLRKARQADTAANLTDWVNSPGLQPPK